MENVAYIFPGQGLQYVGMGKELYEIYPEAREVFDKADEVLKFELTKLCFEGPTEELTMTSNSQVAILIHSIAALKVLEKTSPERFTPNFALGLSLGEYTALVASGSLSFEDGVKLVRKRGQFMKKASEKNPGKMASIIGMELGELEKLCKGFGCEIANLNCPGQVVISGSTSSVELAANMAKEKGAKRAITLDVSGAFHSSLMEPAKEKLEKEINTITFNTPEYPIICNVTAKPTRDPEEIKQNLITQVTSKTLFNDSINYVASQGIKTYLEIGPGTVLKGLLRRIDKSLNVINLEKPADFSALLTTESQI
ncbi:MAG: ACP S-malonyltransferase [Candidatus Omnitrophica bacterium]|nr:ACP S-malonyltransferase [Candidatus Omnitrophota bacterium]